MVSGMRSRMMNIKFYLRKDPLNFFFSFFKTYPEIRTQYFGFLNNLNEEELEKSPRLHSHASGVVLGVSQIINGLENPVRHI